MAQTSAAETTTKKRKNYLSYPYDYYAGSSARIFFNHVWVDDIVTLQYNFNQNKAPIWGYASQKFDVVAKGQIIINGNFTVAFKEAGYLTLIHNEIKKLNSRKTQSKSEILNYWLGKGKPIEKILDELYMSDDNTKSDFEDLAESLEDYVWNKFDSVAHKRLIRPDEFDYKEDGSKGIDIGGFDIVATFGDYTDDAAEHTVKVIKGVHITGESMVLSPDGNPVGISYAFFARGLDEEISDIYNIDNSKKPSNELDSSSDKQLDAEYTQGWDASILEVYDKSAEKITNLTGKNFLDWIGNNVSYDELKSLTEKLKSLNINDTENLKNIRSNIKQYLLTTINNINIETFMDGIYGSSGYNIQTIKFDIKLYIGSQDLDTEEKIDDTLSRTLQSVQFKYMNSRWSDFSDDDEYNMKNAGITNPNDLPRYSTTDANGNIVKQSQNERNADIVASANMDNLKKIYSEQVANFADTKEGLEEQRKDDEDKENKRQVRLNQEHIFNEHEIKSRSNNKPLS